MAFYETAPHLIILLIISISSVHSHSVWRNLSVAMGFCQTHHNSIFLPLFLYQPSSDLGYSQFTGSCIRHGFLKDIALTDVTRHVDRALRNVDGKFDRSANNSGRFTLDESVWESFAGQTERSLDDRQHNHLAFVKVARNSPTTNARMSKSSVQPCHKQIQPFSAKSHLGTIWIAVLTLATLFFGVFFGTIISMVILRRRNHCEEDEEYLDLFAVIPTRFSYQDLQDATEKFCIKIGEGGFGSVYRGSLRSGTKIAVKCLDGKDSVMKKSFFAEVEATSSVHHINLVRLIGFCAEKAHKLLVYEYVCNGSLDKWIFGRNQDAALNWLTRKEIICGIAKGLAYLHEDCVQKILHLDIKPQNILLDNKFNAKVSDFGLSRLISRDESIVITTLKGTFGYLAPEWIGSVVTEKVDVYSFGVVVLEIVCGRRSVDLTLPEDDIHLLRLLDTKMRENHVCEIIDNSLIDMQLHGEDAVEMLKLAAWCLQYDPVERPPMSTVVKVLEGLVDIKQNLCYNLFTTAPSKTIDSIIEAGSEVQTLVNSSILSGPR